MCSTRKEDAGEMMSPEFRAVLLDISKPGVDYPRFSVEILDEDMPLLKLWIDKHQPGRGIEAIPVVPSATVRTLRSLPEAPDPIP